MIDDVLVLPMPRALLPALSLSDPVAGLRAACAEAVDKLLASDPERIIVVAPEIGAANRQRGLSDPLGHRVARHLFRGRHLEEVLALPYTAASLIEHDTTAALVVMADGSARRGVHAPGHLHPGSVPFDDSVETALRLGDAGALAGLDPELAAEVWCEGAPAFRVLGEIARGRSITAELTYADAPRGVAWWVARWSLGPDARAAGFTG